VNPRPTTLREIAERSDSLSDFGRNLRDWLHQIRRVSSRPQAAAAIAEEPPLLREKFLQGDVADSWLAAYADHLAGKAHINAPKWAFSLKRISPEPLFDQGGAAPALRFLALERSPLAFKRRNIFTPAVDLPLSLRAGRPEKSVQEKRKVNAERQRRFRQTQAEELRSLRVIARRAASVAQK
jgi:hypothetical protein